MSRQLSDSAQAYRLAYIRGHGLRRDLSHFWLVTDIEAALQLWDAHDNQEATTFVLIHDRRPL